MKKIVIAASLESCKLSSSEMKNLNGGSSCTVHWPSGDMGGYTIAQAKASGYGYTCESSTEQPK